MRETLAISHRRTRSGRAPPLPVSGARAEDASVRRGRPDRAGPTSSAPASDWAERDRRLMERIRDGDEDALRRLFDLYWDRLVAYAAGIMGPREECQDVVLQAFVRVWRHREGWGGADAPSAYLYRVTRNLALNARRDRALRKSRQADADPAEPFSLHHRTPAQRLEADTVQARVEAAVAALPERRREAFVLSRYHGLSYAEIAEAMEISDQTVANQVSAALAQLRVALAPLLRDL